jgi:hypothetical protein
LVSPLDFNGLLRTIEPLPFLEPPSALRASTALIAVYSKPGAPVFPGPDWAGIFASASSAPSAVAEKEAMKPERLATLVANLKPNDLAPDESIAFDSAFGLVRGGTLPEPLCRLAIKTFGQHGTNELIYLVGLYCLVSTTLNGFNVPVPERE